jgi:lipoyl(octanoyl) transferase
MLPYSPRDRSGRPSNSPERPAKDTSMHVELLSDLDHDGQALCSYSLALARMTELIGRTRDAEDVVLAVQHPPTITLGRRGGREHVHGTVLHLAGHEPVAVQVHEIARGGSVTYHAPGQLVLYPIVQLPRLSGDPERLPHGDLPQFVRLLERVMAETCGDFDLETTTRAGFSGLWRNERQKLASIGIGVRNGWSFHGLALNINTRLEGFDLITACALDGVSMTSMWRELQTEGKPTPGFAAVRDVLLERLAAELSTGELN